MPIFVWNDQYSLDIQEIDEQHKVLVNLINSVYDGMAERKGREHIGQILDQLIEYTRTHFAVEECLLRIFGYPGYEAHKQLHDNLVHKVVQMRDNYMAGRDQTGMELLDFLKTWLTSHILHNDKDYSTYLHKQGVKRRWLRRFW